MYYLITFHESDGNDCTVYDAIEKAASEELALAQLALEVEERMTGNGTCFEPDGSEFGYDFNCPDDCESLANLDDIDMSEPCGRHTGGLVLREVQAFDSLEAAEAAHPYYHSWL